MSYANARPAGFSSEEDSDYELECLSTSEKRIKNHYQWKPPEMTEKEKLFNAVKTGNLQNLEEILKSGNVDVNCLDSGWSPLMYACFEGNADIVKYLLENEANVDFHKEFYTPLMAVCASSIRPNENRTKCVQLLMEHGAKVDDADRFRMTSLMFASREGNCELIQELIKFGAAINSIDNNGHHALFHAVQAGKEDAVDVLIKAGSKLQIVDKRDQTLYNTAIANGFEKIAEKFYVPNPEEDELFYNILPVNTINLMISQMPSRNRGENAGFSVDVLYILQGINMQQYFPTFIKSDVQLGDFLVISDERLKELGVMLSYHRNKIRESIKKFHLHQWSKSSIKYDIKEQNPDLMVAVKIMANMARQLHVLKASLLYVQLHRPNQIKSAEFKEYLDISLKESKKLHSEINKLRELGETVNKKQKVVCGDLIQPEKSPPASSMVVKITVAFAIGIIVWRKKEFCMKLLKLS